jgi:hypothetical protein
MSYEMKTHSGSRVEQTDGLNNVFVYVDIMVRKDSGRLVWICWRCLRTVDIHGANGSIAVGSTHLRIIVGAAASDVSDMFYYWASGVLHLRRCLDLFSFPATHLALVHIVLSSARRRAPACAAAWW